MSKQVPTIGFFFGAGAETGYGLPSGGRFALDIFRQDSQKDKELLRQTLDSIKATTIYAGRWLPESFKKRRLFSFGKSDFDSIINSTLEHRRKQIATYLLTIDTHADRVVDSWPIKRKGVEEAFKAITNESLDNQDFTQAVRFNDRLGEANQIFSSRYFSALLRVYREKSDPELGKGIMAILQLVVGVHGTDLVHELNNELFTDAPDEIPLFDDITGTFSLDYSKAGAMALELVQRASKPCDEKTSKPQIFRQLAVSIIEDLLSRLLDYQLLIDSHFSYLYYPSSHWAKFTKIAIYLMTVRRYMDSHLADIESRLDDDPGYYHDIENRQKKNRLRIVSVATANYNNIAGRVISNISPIHLNGSTTDFYDPYTNAIERHDTLEGASKAGKILVPFLLTQSGTKPLTSIDMARRFVDTYDNFIRCDIVVVLGYSFARDDGHINGMFRKLVDENGKRVCIVEIDPGSDESRSIHRRDLQERLRVTNMSLISILYVNFDRTGKTSGKLWIDEVLSILTPELK